jgi:hypothetical protein
VRPVADATAAPIDGDGLAFDRLQVDAASPVVAVVGMAAIVGEARPDRRLVYDRGSATRRYVAITAPVVVVSASMS